VADVLLHESDVSGKTARHEPAVVLGTVTTAGAVDGVPEITVVQTPPTSFCSWIVTPVLFTNACALGRKCCAEMVNVRDVPDTDAVIEIRVANLATSG
jgi:hypothetical protein